MIRPYKGRRSILTTRWMLPAFEEIGLSHWRRDSHNPERAAAIRELARRLKAAGIESVAGPVLSGALFAQAVADAVAGINAVYLPKPGYKIERHGNWRGLTPPWVFVDDVMAGGRSVHRAVHTPPTAGMGPPEAIVVFAVMGHHKVPREWIDVPILVLRGRERRS
jgi:adenine/guanine phosphoribosyltransferase-like PRPP-binding protein